MANSRRGRYRARVDGNVGQPPAAALVPAFGPHGAPLVVGRRLRGHQERAHGGAVHVVCKAYREGPGVCTLGPQRKSGGRQPKRARRKVRRRRLHVHVGPAPGFVVGTRARQNGARAAGVPHPRVSWVVREAALVFVERTAQRVAGDRRQRCGHCSGQRRGMRA